MKSQNAQHRRSLRVGSALLAACLVFAACGDDDDDAAVSTDAVATTEGSATTEATESTEGSATTAATESTEGSATTEPTPTTAPEPGEPFVIGAIGTYSGPIALIGAEQGIQAWADSVNANGGVAGHPIELHTRDDGGDPAAALTAAKELVEEKGIIAVVGQASAAAAAIAEYLDTAGIPVIGGLDTGEPFFSDPNWFSIGGSSQQVGIQVVDLIKQNGGTKVGVMSCIEAPTCADTVAAYERIVADSGLELAYSELVSLAAPDYTAPCLAAQAAGVDALIISLTPAAQINVYESCEQQGMEFLKIGIGSSVSAEFLSVPAMDGYTGVQLIFPFHESSSDAAAEFQAVMAEFAPDAVVDGIAVGAFPAMTYLSGKMFEAAVAAGNLGNGATAADVIAAMYEIPDGETLGGLVPPMTYVEGEPTIVECYFLQEISGGQFVSTNGLETVCNDG